MYKLVKQTTDINYSSDRTSKLSLDPLFSVHDSKPPLSHRSARAMSRYDENLPTDDSPELIAIDPSSVPKITVSPRLLGIANAPPPATVDNENSECEDPCGALPAELRKLAEQVLMVPRLSHHAGTSG